jgi:myo-inositol-1(or 4)-monophosphatase
LYLTSLRIHHFSAPAGLLQLISLLPLFFTPFDRNQASNKTLCPVTLLPSFTFERRVETKKNLQKIGAPAYSSSLSIYSYSNQAFTLVNTTPNFTQNIKKNMSSSSSTPGDSSTLSSPFAESPASSISEVSTASLTDLDDALFSCLLQNLNLQKIRDVLITIAREAGKMIKAADPSVDTSDTKKNTSDRVTATDKAVEAMVKQRLFNEYPDFDFLGEESFKEGQELSDEPTFVCDPIDGTLNFIHGFPNVAVSLAFTVAKKSVVGVVYNPFRDELFTAIKGRGAFLTRYDGTVLSLPMKRNPDPLEGLNGCLVAVEWGSERQGPNWDLRSGVANKLLSSKATGGAMVHSVRSNGSAALDLCYVGAGWIDVFWEGGCWIWDICAGWLIVEEAGGLMAGANPQQWAPSLEGRSYLAVRGAPSGQHEVVEELWNTMDGKKFAF